MHEVIAWYIVEKNEFNKKIKTLEKEVKDLNGKYIELEDAKSHMYDSYEEKVRDMSEYIYVRHYLRAG